MPPRRRHTNKVKTTNDGDGEEDLLEDAAEEPQAKKKRAPLKGTIIIGDTENISEEYDENEDLLTITIPPKPTDFSAEPEEYRLMVHKIEVVNFKSYRGSHKIGPLHKNLTMVLGPNGSGKSNVIDALLFVFGFRSQKIRSKKVSSLIHTAAALGDKQCTYCVVEIHMVMIKDIDEDRFLIKPGSEFTISRTAYADNTAKYAINGATVSFKQVEALLSSVGVDLTHNRFLILQGEVEAIAMMKPKAAAPGEQGMLEYIEDLVGSNRFIPHIRKLEQRVSSIEVKCSQQSLKVREMEILKKELEPHVKHAQQFISAQNRLANMTNKLLQYDRHLLTIQKNDLENEIKEKESVLKDLEARRRQMQTEIKEIEASENEIAKEEKNVLDEIEMYKDQIREAEAAEAKRNSNLKKCNNELVRLTTELEKEKRNYTEVEQIPFKAENRIKILSEESRELLEQEQKEIRIATNNLVKYDKKAADEKERKKAHEVAFAEKNAILNDARSKLTIAEAELKDLKEIADRDGKKLDELKSSLKEKRDRLEEHKAEVKKLKKLLPPEERALRDTQVELPHVKASESEMRTKMNNLRVRYEAESSKYQTLVHGSKVHMALMNAKATGRLSGLLGRLGDLGAIDEIYDAAISTNCPQLDWYVVETANDGQLAIDYLIEMSLPRRSFMCIEQTLNPANAMNRHPREFPAPRLFDQLRISDSRIRKIFYQCVGDILVVPTLRDAQRIDQEYKGKYRIVTYDGSTIERTGAVSGGGKPITGKIGRDVRMPSEEMQYEQRKLKEELDSVSTEHHNVFVTMQQLETKLYDLTKKVHGMKEKLKEHETVIPELQVSVDSLNRLVVEFENKAAVEKVDRRVIAQAEEKVKKLVKERDDAEKIANEVKRKLDSSTNKLDAMFNELVQKYKDRSKVAKERHIEVEKEIAKERASITTSQHNIVQLKSLISDLETQIMKKRIECDALSSAESDGKEAFTYQDLVRNRQKKMQLLTQNSAELRSKRNELENDERDQNKKVLDMRDQLSSMNQALDDTELTIENISRKLGGIKLHKVPNFKKYMNMKARKDVIWSIDGGTNEKHQRNNEEEVHIEEHEIRELEVLDEDDFKQMQLSDLTLLRDAKRELEKFLEENRENTDESLFHEYAEKSKRYVNEIELLDELAELLIAHKKMLIELRRRRYKEFSEALAFLAATTQMLYQLITNGGDANLSFVEEGGTVDPFESGVKFSVRPAKKSWKLIENLSGGEKTLASLCFVFAMHQYRPTPFYIMDEIDAALDFQNVQLIADYIKNSERTKNAQFLIISLRAQMFEVANRLVGIYKVNDCTRNVVIAPSISLELVRMMQKKLTLKEKKDDEIPEEECAELEAEQLENWVKDQVMVSRKSLERERRTIDKKVLKMPNIVDIEPVSNGKEISAPAVPTTSGGGDTRVADNDDDFNFDEDDEPVRKRRRKTVRDEDEEDEEEVDQKMQEGRSVPMTRSRS